ncbi:IS1595 family transposase [Candidatus Gottesmanbacteria bacterium]|nr:IS1595 family transposase [Candidatus Gottesmanbacteria bacterium]
MDRRKCIFCRYYRARGNSLGRIYCPRCKRRYSFKRAERLGKIIEYFALEIPANKASKVLHLNYKTVYRVYQRLREKIAGKTKEEFRKLSGEIEIDDAYFGGRRKGNRGRAASGKTLVLGMLERDGRVFTTLPENLELGQVLDAISRHAEKGSVFYTDQFRSYKSLFIYGRHLSLNHAEKFANGRVHINGLEGFWSFAKERMLKYHGISKKHFALYLKELEFRYNHRKQDLIKIFTELW